MTFKICTIAALLLTGCGPDWSDCTTCKPGEASVESVDGGQQIPVVVNVDVTVNVDQNQSQTQTQTTNNPGDVTNNDGGSDGGTRTCRKVCTCYEERQHCDRGWHHSDHKGRCNPKPKFKKCVKEVTQCS